MQLQEEFLCISRILLYVLFLQLSQTAPPPPRAEIISTLTASTALLSPSTPPPSSPTSPNLTSGGGAASNGRCASRANFPSWYARNWIVEDCYAALQQLYLKETLLHPNQDYEFIQPGASRKHSGFPLQQTPRKYIVKSCALTVMMLNRFGPGELPSPAGPHPVTNTDVSTYQKIWAAARRLEYACPDTGTPGWCVVGDQNAMGVFFWATDSDINSKFRGVPIVDLPDANVSVIDAIDGGQTS